MEQASSRGLCLDTDVSIALINGLPESAGIMDVIAQREIFLSSVTIFELFLRKTNLELVDVFIRKAEILDFDEGAAKVASSLEKKLTRIGRKIPVRDLFIAATVIANDCEFLTFNRKDFEKVEGLKLLDF